MTQDALVPRRAASAVADALADTRVVLITGARQCGKSTLVRVVAKNKPAEWRDLDRATTRQAAISDPTGFVAYPELMVIDEIQRVPELLLAIKAEVDDDPRPGRFLLTGSARVLGLKALPDTLPGRTETVELWPFSQGEIDGAADQFVDGVFRAGAALSYQSSLSRRDYAERLVRGGFPEAVRRPDSRRREHFFDSYVSDLIARDVSQLSEIERPAQMRVLLRLIAARSGQLLVGNALSRAAGISTATTHRYISLLEETFLIKRIPAWSRNLSSRATGTPKVAFVDSGIAANLLGADAPSCSTTGRKTASKSTAFWRTVKGRSWRSRSKPHRPCARRIFGACVTCPTGLVMTFSLASCCTPAPRRFLSDRDCGPFRSALCGTCAAEADRQPPVSRPELRRPLRYLRLARRR